MSQEIPNSKKQSFFKKLMVNYRLVLMNEATFEEKLSFQLSRLNVLVLLSLFIITFSLVILSILIFTPLKEYIPGYADVSIRKDMVFLRTKSDSLENVLSQQMLWMNNIKQVLQDQIEETPPEAYQKIDFFDTVKLEKLPLEDILLREEIERESGFALLFSDNQKKANSLSEIIFFAPIKGFITATFNKDLEHFGIDLAAKENTPVLATLDGTVVFSGWTSETGFVIAVQHAFNLITFYKHNAALLKKNGNFVKAGEPIAIIGNSGELSNGPHLHFEIWKDGVPVNPQDYLIF